MNILLVRNEFINKSYYTSDYLQLRNALINLGHNVIIAGLGDKNNFEKDLILLKPLFNKRRFTLIKFSFFIPFYCIIKKINVVFVDNRLILSTLILIIIKKVLGIKIILDIRSIPVEMSLPTDYKLSCNIASHFYDGATFITNGTKEYIEQLINKKFTHFAIFPSAVNPEFFSPLHINNVPDSIVQKTKGKIVLFYHGSISPNRGINIIIEAVNQVKDIFPNLLFISVSNRNDYISDYCKANNYELNEYLLLLDAVKYEEMAGYINLADICIVPLPRLLWWEISSPLKLMEYLAMEKPIVLSDIIAHKSVIPQDSKFALFFNPDDPNDLGKKINEAINNIKYLKANSFMGREIVLNKYTWDIQAKIIEDFIGVLH